MYQGAILEFLNMGGGEMMLIVVAILLLFGGKKLPELARGLGKGIREFKDASEGVKREIHRNINAVDIEDELKEMDDQRNKVNPVVDEPTLSTATPAYETTHENTPLEGSQLTDNQLEGESGQSSTVIGQVEVDEKVTKSHSQAN